MDSCHSNAAERLVSPLKYVLSDYRKRLLPNNFSHDEQNNLLSQTCFVSVPKILFCDK